MISANHFNDFYMIYLPFSFLFISQDVSGQVILITGGGGGVGAHLARNFGKLKAKVVIWDVNNDGKIIVKSLKKLSYPVLARQ